MSDRHPIKEGNNASKKELDDNQTSDESIADDSVWRRVRGASLAAGTLISKSRKSVDVGSVLKINHLAVPMPTMPIIPMMPTQIPTNMNLVNNKFELMKRTQASIRRTTQLGAFVPDFILQDEGLKIPYLLNFDAVTFMADVSGFTALTEKYSLKGNGGTDQLTKTLSSYMGPLAECILRAKGDIIKYAGDAILAVWKVFDVQTYPQEIERATDCALYIQEKYGSYETDVGITIRVKLGIGAGKIHQCGIGNQEYHHFVCFGPGVESASFAEKHCESGDVILSPACWNLIDSSHFLYTMKPDNFKKVHEIIGFANPELRGRPIIIPRRTVLGPTKAALNLNNPAEQIRPIMFEALQKKSELQLRHYVIPPVLKKFDDDIPLEYLNESRITSVCFIKIDLKPFEASLGFGETMMSTVQYAFKYIYKNCTVLQGCLSKIIMFDKGLTYLVIFGLPGYIHDNQSAHALKFSYRVKSQLQGIKHVSEVSLGVTSGQTYCGVLGHYLRQEYTVIGRVVNKAARLMCYYPGKVTCDQDTLYHSKLPVHHFSLMEHKELKGIQNVGNIYEYLGAETGEDQSVKTFDYPLVGRDVELLYFKTIVGAAVLEHERFVQTYNHVVGDFDLKGAKEITATGLWSLIFEGDVGIGKSRLLAACIAHCDETGIKVFSVEMNALLASTRLYAIQSLMSQAFGMDEMRTPQEREEHIRKIVGGDIENIPSICLLNDLFHLRFPMHSKYVGTDLLTRHVLAQQALNTLIRHFYPDEIVTLVIDDGHLMDSTSWEYLQAIAKSPTVFALVSLRRSVNGLPRLVESVSKIIYNNKNIKTVRLNGIDRRFSLALACQVMEVAAIPTELEKIIMNKSQGIPAWIDQVLKDMLRSGLLKIVGKDAAVARSRNLKMSEVDPALITPIQHFKKLSGRKKMFDYNRDELRASGGYLQRSKSEGFLAVESSINLPVRVQKEVIRPEVRMCIVKSDTNITAAPIPGTLKEILLDTFDELESNEQMLLKCASVCGLRFSRAMLIRIVPAFEVNSKKYDFGFRHLMESGMLRCASRQTRASAVLPSVNNADGEDAKKKEGTVVQCYCRFSKDEIKWKANEIEGSGIKLDNLDQAKPKYYNCKYMEFAKENMLEVIYELMTEDQRKELHLKAAKYLDTSTVRCRLHGGIASEYEFGFQLKGTDIGGDNEDALRAAALYARKKRISSKRSRAQSKANTTNRIKNKRGSLAARIDGLKKLYKTDGTKIGDIEVDILKGIDDLKIKSVAHQQKNSFMKYCFYCFRRDSAEDDAAKEWEFTIAAAKKLEREATNEVEPPEIGKSLDGNNESVTNTSRRQSVRKESGDSSSYKAISVVESDTDSRSRYSTIDLRGCECASLQTKVCVEMVKHYRKAEKYGKCLFNLLDAAESSITNGNSGQSLVHLEDAVALLHAIDEKQLPEPDENDGDDRKIDHKKATIDIEFLNGLAYYELGVQHKARDSFFRVLTRLGLSLPQEDDKIARDAAILHGSSTLWRHHTFTCFSSATSSKMAKSEKDKLKEDAGYMKLRTLSYLHKLFRNERRADMALLVALWQSIVAEDIRASFLDVIPAYSNLMETYSLMSNHKKAEYYENLALDLIRDSFATPKSHELMGLLTCANLFHTTAMIRLVRGDISTATESAYLSLRIAQAIHDNTLSVHVLPMVIQSLLFSLRISEMIEALQKLWYIAEEEEDWGGVAIYYTLCLDLLLNTAYPLEPFYTCENFVNNSDWNSDIQMFREYEVQYNMEASLALWYCRYSRWDGAQRWKALAESHRPKVTTFLSVSAELKLLEANLILVNHYLESKRYQHFAKARNSAKELMRILKKSTKAVPIFLARFEHLMGYYCRIRSRNAECEKYLKKAEKLAILQSNNLELEWISHNRKVWTESAIPTLKFFWLEHTENHSLDWHQSGKVPWTNIMYSLPLPSWKS